MKLAQRLSSMVLALRKKESIKVRQPLRKMMVPALSKELAGRIESVRDVVLAEVNVKELEILEDVSGVLVKKIKPDFKKLGPKVGKHMKQVAAAIGSMDQADIDELESSGSMILDLGEAQLNIGLEDVVIITEDIPGWLITTEDHVTVALDISIDEELRYEGIARELVNRIQNLRKDSGLEVTDHIALKLEKNQVVSEALKRNESYITQETLTTDLQLIDELEEGLDVEFDGISTRIFLEKV
jgi:isoleucyl-tRNA synthetase